MAVMTSRFADGLAVGSDLVAAAETAVGQALSSSAARPTWCASSSAATIPTTVARAGRARDAAGARRPQVIGCSATGVIGDGQGVELTSAVSAWAATLRRGRADHVRAGDADRRGPVRGGRPAGARPPTTTWRSCWPTRTPSRRTRSSSGPWRCCGGLPLVGGLANGMQGRRVGPAVRRRRGLHRGAIGVLLGGAVGQHRGQPGLPADRPDHGGHRGRGEPAAGAGRPAGAGPAEESSASSTRTTASWSPRGLQIGVAMDEYAERHERGDFLIRGVIGIDPEREAVAIGDVVEVGRTVRFQVRDAATADEDLYDLLDATARSSAGDRRRAAVLVQRPRLGDVRHRRPRSGRAARHARPDRDRRASSPPARSARWAARTTCTASPRRSWSSRHPRVRPAPREPRDQAHAYARHPAIR